MAKKMILNCGACDARNVSEATLAAYESIVINAGDIIVTPESRELLNRYAVTMNCGDVLELEKDVKIRSVNGSAQIKSTDTAPAKTYLDVNGSLEIAPNTEKVLEQYVGIKVNGSVLYPQSMGGCMGLLSVNGSTVCYPDDAVILKRSAVIDKMFTLRAKDRLYWAARRMIMVDPDLDAGKLAAKGARFSTKEVILAESKTEAMAELIDEKAEIVIVPDGTRVVLDDVELSDGILKQYGRKLYVIGDLRVPQEGGDTLAAMEYLNVRGNAAVAAEWKSLLMEKAEISGDVKPLRGRYIDDKMSVRVSKWMLEQEKDGLSISDCMKVKIDEDIPSELIMSRLSIRDCMNVVCKPEQEAALGAVCEDVLKIGSGDEMDIGGFMGGIFNGGKELPDTKVINAGEYVL